MFTPCGYYQYHNPCQNLAAGLLGFSIGASLGAIYQNNHRQNYNDSIFVMNNPIYNAYTPSLWNLQQSIEQMAQNSIMNFYRQMHYQANYFGSLTIPQHRPQFNTYQINPFLSTGTVEHVEKPNKPKKKKKTSKTNKEESSPPDKNKKEVSKLTLSKSGTNFIKETEQFVEYAYYDNITPLRPATKGDENNPNKGTLTIGYGHTKNVKIGDKITKDEADELFLEDVSEFEQCIKDNVNVPLTQNQYDALVSFCYNVGTGAFKKSTLLAKLNNEDYIGAANEFLKWNKSGGKVIDGLTDRRKAEKNMFLA